MNRMLLSSRLWWSEPDLPAISHPRRSACSSDCFCLPNPSQSSRIPEYVSPSPFASDFVWNCYPSWPSPLHLKCVTGSLLHSQRSRPSHSISDIGENVRQVDWPRRGGPFAEASAPGGGRNGSTEMRS